MSTAALLSALSGLRVNQAGLNVASNNISNATVEGYTRKTLPLETLVAGGEVIGVKVGEIQRHVDQYIMRDYRTQLSLTSKLDTRESYLDRIVSFHGRPEEENNIAAKLGRLKNIFADLAATPESRVLRTEAVDVAKDLSDTFNRNAELLLEQRNQTQAEIQQSVWLLNEKLREVAEYNKRIIVANNLDKTTAALEDERDKAIKEISNIIEVSYYEDGDGALVVQTNGGLVLADREVRELSFETQRLGYKSAYPFNINGLMLEGINQDFDLTDQDIGGSLGALLEIRDKTIPTFQAQLDELAHKMALRFDAQDLRLFTDKSGVVPADIPEDYAGFSSLMQVNPQILNDTSLIHSGTGGATPDQGDSTLLTNIVDYTFGLFQDAAGTPHVDFRTENIGAQNAFNIDVIFESTTLEDFARNMISRQAEAHHQTEIQYDSEEVYLVDVEKRIMDDSAVNSDFEMANLIQLQRNYTAAAKMITTLDEIFAELMNAVR